MPAADEPLRYRRLRAPAEDQTALIEPPLSEAKALVAKNQAKALDWDRLSGLPFSAWRRQARSEFLPTGAEESSFAKPFVMSGHQPILFHPGVWLKTFVLQRIADDVGGIACDIPIDNDTIRTARLRVPSLSDSLPQIVEIPFDAPSLEMPWEERMIVDPELFGSFSSRVLAAYQPLLEHAGPRKTILLEPLWEQARKIAADRHISFFPRTLGACLTRSRHELERSKGLHVHSWPLSYLCELREFSEFADQVFRRAHEFREIYNTSLAEYRATNHIRSRSHPVPDLTLEGEWVEVPFWTWRKAEPQRRRAFVRKHKSGWKIRWGSTVFSRDQAWSPRHEESNQIKIRPRALITTMYARLVLSDLFIHGIGVAKYDELTDAIIRRFFNIEPPAYVTATATVRLPIIRPRATPEDLIALDRRYRDTIHHPEQFLDDYTGHHRADFNLLVAQKKELITHGWPEKQKKVWHDQMTACNERMSVMLEPLRDRLRHDHERLTADLHAARMLGSREFSFCLFPEEMLVPLLKKMAGIQS